MTKIKKIFVMGATVTVLSIVGVTTAFAASNPRLDSMKSMMQQRVEQGYLTQEAADAMYQNMLDNGGSCHGTNGRYNGSGMMNGYR